MRPLFLIIVAIIVLFTSCDIINPDEKIPSYIAVEKMDLSTNYSNEGTSSHNIVDAWIYVDDKLLGIYELPATLPVIAEGTHTLKIRAGVKNSGSSIYRVEYPFYDFFTATIQLFSQKITSATPTVKYYSTVKFKWREDFESGSTIEKTSGSDTSMTVINSDSVFAYLGKRIGAVYLDGTRDYFEGKTSPGPYILTVGNHLFLEMNYKSDNEFRVGLIKYTPSSSTLITLPASFKPNSSWEKFYVDMTSFLRTYSDGIYYDVVLTALLDNGDVRGEILLDNIKLVHF